MGMIDFKTCLESIWRKKNLNNNSLRTNHANVVEIMEGTLHIQKVRKSSARIQEGENRSKKWAKIQICKTISCVLLSSDRENYTGNNIFFSFWPVLPWTRMCQQNCLIFFNLFQTHDRNITQEIHNLCNRISIEIYFP